MIKKQLTITSLAILASVSLILLSSFALLSTQVAQAGDPGVITFEKSITGGDCLNDEVLVKAGSSQTCHFQIVYLGPPAVITDAIPGEWFVTGFFDDVTGGECGRVTTGNVAKNPNVISCGIQTDITVDVWLTTRINQGGGHKEGPVFKPTTCDPNFVVNEGAFAISVAEDPFGDRIFEEQSNSITINAFDEDDPDCIGLPEPDDD